MKNQTFHIPGHLLTPILLLLLLSLFGMGTVFALSPSSFNGADGILDGDASDPNWSVNYDLPPGQDDDSFGPGANEDNPR